MFNRIISFVKNFTPTTLIAIILITAQLIILLVGWGSDWWVNTKVADSSKILSAINSYQEQMREIENQPASDSKVNRMQKISYQMIYDENIQLPELQSLKEWSDLKKYAEATNINQEEMPDLENRIINLQTLISSFNDFATQNNYPTLARITNRMKLRNLSNMEIRVLENALFAYSKDVEFMSTVVKTSNLDDDKKNLLQGKITELGGLISATSLSTKESAKNYSSTKNLWASAKNFINIAKSESLKTSMRNASSFNSQFYMLLSLFIITCILGAWGVYQESIAKKKARSLWESSFVSLINDTFVKGIRENKRSEFSQGFTSTINQIHEFIQKKMNYGQMFQDTIPFPTILIDSNLQVRWFNQSLVQEWQLEDYIKQRESLSWEHFSQLTNMSANDPVIDVIKNQHAGIFKLQVKPLSLDSNPVPYQMYVTPYQIGDEKLCLLFFYPLLSMEETIEMQTQSIVAPVKRTLEAILNDAYNDEFYVSSKSDYEVGSIDELHELFSRLHAKHHKSQQDFMIQLEEREIKLQDYEQLIHQFDSDVEQMKRLQEEMRESFQNMKVTLVASFEGVENVKDQFENFRTQFMHHWSGFQLLSQQATKLQEVFISSKEQLGYITQLKTTAKEVRDAIQTHRSNSLKVIKAMGIFIEKQTHTANPLHNTWNATLAELAKLPDFFTSLDRYVHYVDSTLGKVSMRLEDVHKSCNADFYVNQDNALVETVGQMMGSFKNFDEAKEILVSNLKEIYLSIQHQVKVINHANEKLYVSNSRSGVGTENENLQNFI